MHVRFLGPSCFPLLVSWAFSFLLSLLWKERLGIKRRRNGNEHIRMPGSTLYEEILADELQRGENEYKNDKCLFWFQDRSSISPGSEDAAAREAQSESNLPEPGGSAGRARPSRLTGVLSLRPVPQMAATSVPLTRALDSGLLNWGDKPLVFMYPIRLECQWDIRDWAQVVPIPNPQISAPCQASAGTPS